MPASSGSRESPVVKKLVLKRFSSCPLAAEGIQPAQGAVVHPAVLLRQVAIDPSLDEHVHFVVGQEPNVLGLADQVRIGEHHPLQLIRGPDG